ncbi:hypothetical protein [Spongiactinospora sp. TRM90649]|uniref:hypothetical protein n=1 Tax=Spongiactinospora sp. TRM90649 TaxID=3031114 RepID=UPI0023F63DFF|nr:hypothetical protein [Spongiactinospora sp. TRM90649]MDF5753125.1 hypothetical protein [Spongiactinospora sp. TRM90649]
MLNGDVRLSLLIGPAVPIPVGRQVIEAVESISVVAAAGDTQSGFEIVFRLSRRSPLHTLFLLTGGVAIPVMRVVIAVTIRGRAEVLMDGVMLHHEVRDGAGEPTLVVKGKDLSAVMDWFAFDGFPYPAMPPVARALAVLAKYAAFGVIPVTIPGIIEDLPIPVESIPRHQGTDYGYLKMLARDAGYVFYLDPGPVPGTSCGYWGPEIRVGPAQPSLNLDLDPPRRNVDSLSFSFDKERKEMPVVWIQEQYSKAPIPIPIPDVTPLNPPLGAVPPLPPKLTFLNDSAKHKPRVALARGISYAVAHSDVVFGQGTLDVVRYGRVLRSRGLVGVRGAGEAFDGLYYVSSVTHSIRRGEYKQSFTLARNGLLSTLSEVPV